MLLLLLLLQSFRLVTWVPRFPLDSISKLRKLSLIYLQWRKKQFAVQFCSAKNIFDTQLLLLLLYLYTHLSARTRILFSFRTHSIALYVLLLIVVKWKRPNKRAHTHIEHTHPHTHNNGKTGKVKEAKIACIC